MPRIFPEYKRSTVYALIGAVFHVVIVVLPLIITGGKVKFIGYMLLWLDFPLFLPLVTTPPNTIKFFMDSMGTIWYFSLFGTLFYVLGGWLIGYARDKYLQMR